MAVENFRAEKDYYVPALHPDEWNISDFEELNEIIYLLKNQKATFMHPSEYYALLYE